MTVAFAPDLGACRLCGATTRQREFWREPYLGAGQSLRRCGHCAALYLGPDFTEEALGAFYAHAYRRLYLTEIMGSDPDTFFRQRFEARFAAERARIVSPLLPRGGSLFELGSGFGSFLGALAEARPDVALHACEQDVAHRDIRCRGAEVQWRARVEDIAGREVFDAVAAFHVLEHLKAPAAFLAWAARALKPGGHLVVEVPDCGGAWPTRKVAHPAHLTYFTAHTLRRVLQAAGFDVLACGAHPSGAPFAGTLLAVARVPRAGGPRAMACAAPDEIGALDAEVGALRWTFSDALASRARRAAVALLGAERVGALLRWRAYRRLRRAWDEFRAI